jgi:hypothetical protein
MEEKLKRKLEKATLEKTENMELATQMMREMTQKIGAVADFQKMFVAVAILEKTSSSKIPTESIQTIIPYNISKELPEMVHAYGVWIRIRKFCVWSAISSIVFLVSGIYLLLSSSMSIEIGGPLVILFGLLSFVFSKKLLQWRKP